MKRHVMMVLVLVAVGGTTEVNAQSFLKKLGKKVENAAKNAIERNAERKTEEAVDKVFEGDFGKGKKDKDKQNNNGNNNADAVYDNGNGDATAQSGKQTVKTAEISWNKFDFVAGDEIIFEDLLVGEKIGEFPSQWDLIEGNIEVVQVDGENAIFLYKDCQLMPLMEDPKNYLPEVFTIEFDAYLYDKAEEKKSDGTYRLHINNGKDDVVDFVFRGHPSDGMIKVDCDIMTPNGEKRNINGDAPFVQSGWQRISVSFNKRALKVYVNETRVVNAPNVAQGSWFSLQGTYSGISSETYFYLKNIRLAQGAVPLYDRMMSDGKFITYGITFDVGKATIKPESMGEINRIVTLMTENPDLKFSVEGHTDSTGNANSNQTLSEQRSQAIVAKLVELGIAQDRLTAVGKGQNSPIADNNTDEGRAKNRRVEFVKM